MITLSCASPNVVRAPALYNTRTPTGIRTTSFATAASRHRQYPARGAGTDRNEMEVTSASVAGVRQQLSSCLVLLREYEWLLNSFVLDFFIDDHWERLPESWRETLGSLSPSQLGRWLDNSQEPPPAGRGQPWPLALLALRKSINTLAVDRTQVGRW